MFKKKQNVQNFIYFRFVLVQTSFLSYPNYGHSMFSYDLANGMHGVWRNILKYPTTTQTIESIYFSASNLLISIKSFN